MLCRQDNFVHNILHYISLVIQLLLYITIKNLDLISSAEMNKDAWHYDSIELQINFTKKTNSDGNQQINRSGVQKVKTRQPSKLILISITKGVHSTKECYISKFLFFPLFVNGNGLIEGLQEKTDEVVDQRGTRSSSLFPLRTSPTNRSSFKTLTPLRLERKKIYIK